MEWASLDEGSSMGLGSRASSNANSSYSTPICSSNIGFKLLKKHGWKEGTGLGISEQGRLEPIQAFMKKNKRGLGADEPKKETKQVTKRAKETAIEDPRVPKSKAKKAASKKMKKMQEFEKRLQEQEFARSFFRDFWPDNV